MFKDLKAAIVGVQGLTLTDQEKQVFTQSKPLGFILFARNVETRDQIKKLCDDLREAVGWHAPILIDQEGGRVARLREPLVPAGLSFETFGDLYKSNPDKAREALILNTEMQASYLNDMGINVNCSPVMDLRVKGAHDIIGDRSLSDDPLHVYELAKIVCETFLSFGITPISKHLPGHGRALSDSHFELPSLPHSLEELRETDFLPFTKLYKDTKMQQGVWGMVAHIVYEQIDKEKPATTSSKVVKEILRQEMAREAFLIADDIGMEALDGTPEERALATVNSGLDATLVCNHSLEEIKSILEITPILTVEAQKRFETGETLRKGAKNKAREPFILEKMRDALLN